MCMYYMHILYLDLQSKALSKLAERVKPGLAHTGAQLSGVCKGDGTSASLGG
jgi:hypothetical protein